MRLTRSTPVLDAVKTILRALSGHYEFTLDAFDRGLATGNSVKLDSLITHGREFMNVTPSLITVAKAAFGDAFREVVSKGGNVRVEYLLGQIGLAMRNHIASARFEQQGDVPLRPLSREWAARKARTDGDPRIGIYRGTLLKAIRRSPFRLRKVR